MPIGLATLLPILLGGGAAGVGAGLSSRAQGRQLEAIQGLMPILQALGEMGITEANRSFMPSQSGLMHFIDSMGMTPENATFLNDIMQTRGGLHELFYNEGLNPRIGYATDRIQDSAASLANPLDVLQQLVSFRGTTGDTRGVFDTAQRGTPGMDLISDLSQLLTRQGGRNNFIDISSQLGQEVMSSGGITPSIGRGLGIAENIASREGRGGGPEAGIFAQLLSGGGMSPYSSALGNLGSSLTAEPALLPTGLVASMMTDKAVRGVEKRGRRAIEQANARGGQAGATVFGGGVNRALAEFAEEAAGAEADALREALMGQQELRLGQQGQGLQALAQALQGTNQRLGMGIEGTTALRGIEANKLANALQAISSLNQTSTNRAGTYGQLGLGGEELATRNMGLAGQLADLVSTDKSRSIGNMLSTLGLETNRLTQGAGLLNQTAGLQGSQFMDIVNAVLGNQGLNVNRAKGLTDSQIGLLGMFGQGLGDVKSNLLNASQLLNQQGAGWLGFGGNMFGGLPGLLSGMPTTSPFGQLLLQGGLGAMLGGLQDMSRRGSGVSNQNPWAGVWASTTGNPNG